MKIDIGTFLMIRHSWDRPTVRNHLNPQPTPLRFLFLINRNDPLFPLAHKVANCTFHLMDSLSRSKYTHQPIICRCGNID